MVHFQILINVVRFYVRAEVYFILHPCKSCVTPYLLYKLRNTFGLRPQRLRQSVLQTVYIMNCEKEALSLLFNSIVQLKMSHIVSVTAWNNFKKVLRVI